MSHQSPLAGSTVAILGFQCQKGYTGKNLCHSIESIRSIEVDLWPYTTLSQPERKTAGIPLWRRLTHRRASQPQFLHYTRTQIGHPKKCSVRKQRSARELKLSFLIEMFISF